MEMESCQLESERADHQLLAIGCNMEEGDIVVITLRSLPKSYEHFIETLNIPSSGVDMKLTDLCTLFLQQDW